MIEIEPNVYMFSIPTKDTRCFNRKYTSNKKQSKNDKYNKVSHEDKKIIKGHLKDKHWKQLGGCENPDVYCVGKNNDGRDEDEIVVIQPNVYQSKNYSKASNYKRERVYTGLKASKILGDNWENRLPVLHLMSLQDYINSFSHLAFNLQESIDLFSSDEKVEIQFIMTKTNCVYEIHTNGLLLMIFKQE